MNNQKGVLIKDGNGQVIEKRVFAGDTSALENNLKAEGVIYALFDDSDPAFIGAAMPLPPPSLEDRVAILETNVSSISKQVNVAGVPANG